MLTPSFHSQLQNCCCSNINSSRLLISMLATSALDLFRQILFENFQERFVLHFMLHRCMLKT